MTDPPIDRGLVRDAPEVILRSVYWSARSRARTPPSVPEPTMGFWGPRTGAWITPSRPHSVFWGGWGAPIPIPPPSLMGPASFPVAPQADYTYPLLDGHRYDTANHHVLSSWYWPRLRSVSPGLPPLIRSGFFARAWAAAPPMQVVLVGCMVRGVTDEQVALELVDRTMYRWRSSADDARYDFRSCDQRATPMLYGGVAVAAMPGVQLAW